MRACVGRALTVVDDGSGGEEEDVVGVDAEHAHFHLLLGGWQSGTPKSAEFHGVFLAVVDQLQLLTEQLLADIQTPVVVQAVPGKLQLPSVQIASEHRIPILKHTHKHTAAESWHRASRNCNRCCLLRHFSPARSAVSRSSYD
ncbi:MAG: hypothetical protein GY820_04515 [Gammaproteobacteria bacterium]|nr:hypothetical protein [Gammaproteobacteria bacterium]